MLFRSEGLRRDALEADLAAQAAGEGRGQVRSRQSGPVADGDIIILYHNGVPEELIFTGVWLVFVEETGSDPFTIFDLGIALNPLST